METKTLQIQQAQEGEGFGKRTIYNYEDFKKELMINKITNIFEDATIKQDKLKYIFAIDGKNVFLVDGQKNLVNRIQEFYKEQGEKEKRGVEQQVLIRITGMQLEYIRSQTKEDLSLLKADIEKTKSSVEKAMDVENIKYHIERNISFLEQEKDLSKSVKKDDKIDKNLRKAYQSQVQDRIDRLYRMKEQIEWMDKNKDKKYTIKRDVTDKTKKFSDVEMDDINGFDMKTTLKQFSERLTDMENDQPNLIASRNDIIGKKGDTTPYYEIIINDIKDAKKINKSLRKVNNQYAILDKVELEGAKRQELSQDLQALEAYLNNVIANPDTFKPSEHPFVPVHTKEFYELTKINPELGKFVQLGQEAKQPTTIEQNVSVGPTVKDVIVVQPANAPREYVPSNYSDAKDAFEKGGLGGMIKYGIDKTNMRPEQKQFRSGVGNLAVTGGIIFMGRKMVSSAFKMLFKSNKDKKTGIYDSSNRAWLGIPTALVFGSQARSGEGPLKILSGGELTRKIADLFGGKKGEAPTGTPQEIETRTKYREGFLGASALFNGLTYGEMKQMLIKDGNQMKISPDKYATILDIYRNGSKKNEAAAKFLESIGKDDEKHVIDLGLNGMGITREQIEDDANKDKKFDKAASNAIANLATVVSYMEEKGYNKINSETQHLVDNYIANGKSNEELDDLAKRGDVFYKELNVIDQTGLKDKIVALANGNKQREEDLLLAINTFYNQMPTANRKIELTGTWPTITFKTYDQSSTVNLENKELVGFTPSRFSSYFETFKAANLTNRIKSICKDKEAKTEKPFYISTIGNDITFDNAKIFSTEFDTEIMTAGWGGELKKVSPALETYKKEYCDYLNNITPRFRKEKPIA